MRCESCGGEAVVYEGVVWCLDCTVLVLAGDGPDGGELVPAGDESNQAGEGCGPAGHEDE